MPLIEHWHAAELLLLALKREPHARAYLTYVAHIVAACACWLNCGVLCMNRSHLAIKGPLSKHVLASLLLAFLRIVWFCSSSGLLRLSRGRRASLCVPPTLQGSRAGCYWQPVEFIFIAISTALPPTPPSPSLPSPLPPALPNRYAAPGHLSNPSPLHTLVF